MLWHSLLVVCLFINFTLFFLLFIAFWNLIDIFNRLRREKERKNFWMCACCHAISLCPQIYREIELLSEKPLKITWKWLIISNFQVFKSEIMLKIIKNIFFKRLDNKKFQTRFENFSFLETWNRMWKAWSKRCHYFWQF